MYSWNIPPFKQGTEVPLMCKGTNRFSVSNSAAYGIPQKSTIRNDLRPCVLSIFFLVLNGKMRYTYYI